MLIVYASKTGNVKRFVVKTGLNARFIEDGDIVSEPFVLITYTAGFGSVPPEVDKFLEKNQSNLVAVTSSGNRNWGSELFARSGDIVSQKYNVPLISKFEMSGTKGDVDLFVERVSEISEKSIK